MTLKRHNIKVSQPLFARVGNNKLVSARELTYVPECEVIVRTTTGMARCLLCGGREFENTHSTRSNHLKSRRHRSALGK